MVPLGYDVRERKLVVSEAEAATVRMIFQRYAELGSVALLKAELERAGIVSKRREGADGELSGGKRFSRGALYLMLQNWLYRGSVAQGENLPRPARGDHRARTLADCSGQARCRSARAVDGRWRRGAESVVGPDLR